MFGQTGGREGEVALMTGGTGMTLILFPRIHDAPPEDLVFLVFVPPCPCCCYLPCPSTLTPLRLFLL